MHISYRNVFTSAWQITIKHKVLWLYGFFASFLSLEAVYEVIMHQSQQAANLQTWQDKVGYLFPDRVEAFNRHVYFINQLPGDFMAYLGLIIFAILMALFVWLILTSQIFIIKSASLSYHGFGLKTKQLIGHSQDKFWTVLTLNVLSKIVLYAGFIGLSLPLLLLFLSKDFQTSTIAYIFFFIIFTFLAVIVSFLTAYATNFIVLKNLNIFEAIKAAWQTFSRNISISFEIAFLLFILKIISLIFILCLGILICLPFSIFLFLSILSHSVWGFALSLLLIILSTILTMAIISAIYTVFYLASWTVAFTKLTEESLMGRLVYYIEQIPSLVKETAKRYNLKINKKELLDKSLELTKKTGQQTKTLYRQISRTYKEYEPTIKKESKVLAKKIDKVYNKLKPEVEKEIKNFILTQKKAQKIKPKTKNAKSKKSHPTKK